MSAMKFVRAAALAGAAYFAADAVEKGEFSMSQAFACGGCSTGGDFGGGDPGPGPGPGSDSPGPGGESGGELKGFAGTTFSCGCEASKRWFQSPSEAFQQMRRDNRGINNSCEVLNLTQDPQKGTVATHFTPKGSEISTNIFDYNRRGKSQCPTGTYGNFKLGR